MRVVMAEWQMGHDPATEKLLGPFVAPESVDEAKRLVNELKDDVTKIQAQLSRRGKQLNGTRLTNPVDVEWKNRIVSALSFKVMKLRRLKQWLHDQCEINRKLSAERVKSEQADYIRNTFDNLKLFAMRHEELLRENESLRKRIAELEK